MTFEGMDIIICRMASHQHPFQRNLGFSCVHGYVFSSSFSAFLSSILVQCQQALQHFHKTTCDAISKLQPQCFPLSSFLPSICTPNAIPSYASFLINPARLSTSYAYPSSTSPQAAILGTSRTRGSRTVKDQQSVAQVARNLVWRL
jgi:hypothetical protein